MRNFNLLISTSRHNEINAKAELWFLLFMMGDEFPLIFRVEFPGLFIALTNLNPKKCIEKLRKIALKNPNFFQYILKITPIEYACETDLNIIKKIVTENFHKVVKKNETFKIQINKRNFKTSKLEIIEHVAEGLNNKVNLRKPDKIVNIEILGNFTGISFITKDDILSVVKEQVRIIQA